MMPLLLVSGLHLEQGVKSTRWQVLEHEDYFFNLAYLFNDA